MLLKDHLIEVFKRASLENNILLKENIVIKWVHRFGIHSLSDLLIHNPALKENQNEEENQEQISSMDEVHEKENLEQIKLKFLKNSENIEEPTCESNYVKNTITNGIVCKNQNSKKINQFTNVQKLPLPNIKNLRKWINNDKKAS